MHCDIHSPKCGMKHAVRMGFGLSLLLVGVNHYQTLGSGFLDFVASDLGPLTFLGTIWAYVFPGLMILGGALFTLGMYKGVASHAAGFALGLIPVGMALKTVVGGVALSDVMPAIVNAFVWIIVYVLLVKFCCCCGSCGTAEGMKK